MPPGDTNLCHVQQALFVHRNQLVSVWGFSTINYGLNMLEWLSGILGYLPSISASAVDDFCTSQALFRIKRKAEQLGDELAKTGRPG